MSKPTIDFMASATILATSHYALADPMKICCASRWAIEKNVFKNLPNAFHSRRHAWPSISPTGAWRMRSASSG